AIALNTKVVTWREEHLGDTHPETLNARNILANNYLESSNDYGLPDRASTAVALHEHNLGEYLRVLGETHRGTPYSWRSLCMAYAAAGRHHDAAALLEILAAALDRNPNQPRFQRLFTDSVLAETYWSLGRRDDALSLLDRTTAQMVSELGSTHPFTLHTRVCLAQLNLDDGRPGAAIDILDQVLAEYDRTYGPDNAQVMRVLDVLASAFERLGRPVDAAGLLTRQLGICEKLLEPGNPIIDRVTADLQRLGKQRGGYPRSVTIAAWRWWSGADPGPVRTGCQDPGTAHRRVT
ncbi:hypothetical protein DMB66_07555, partial [Actinoplanes sp. ATCC 53533]|uniref:tetratricopeptide repeat protein n=1 Tax=Actinoplanes sp. ATCC 53533 TaxID=1288362 RepID=UPI0010003F3E